MSNKKLTEKVIELAAEAIKLKIENQQLEKRIEFLEKQNSELLKSITQKPIQPVQPNPYSFEWSKWNLPTNSCSVCGLNFSGKSMGYVCTNPKCPTAVTCK